MERELADREITGIAKSGITSTVFWVNDDAQPDAVFVTTTVNIPLPLATGFETV